MDVYIWQGIYMSYAVVGAGYANLKCIGQAGKLESLRQKLTLQSTGGISSGKSQFCSSGFQLIG